MACTSPGHHRQNADAKKQQEQLYMKRRVRHERTSTAGSVKWKAASSATTTRRNCQIHSRERVAPGISLAGNIFRAPRYRLERSLHALRSSTIRCSECRFCVELA